MSIGINELRSRFHIRFTVLHGAVIGSLALALVKGLWLDGMPKWWVYSPLLFWAALSALWILAVAGIRTFASAENQRKWLR